MNLVLVGLNHKTAPVAVREKLAFPNTCIVEALHRLVDRSQIEEGLIVSTCNRVEVVAKPLMPHEEAIRHITQFLHTFHDLPEQQVRPHLYVHEDASVVRHLFRVTSSLDSMVVGEAQILGQVKDAYAHAVKAGVAGVLLHRLLERSFSVAKRVRTETGIGAHAVSLGSVAVELARKIFDNLKGKTSLLIGAGEMAELSAKCLFEAGAESLLVANRTLANAQQLATVFRGGGRAMGLDELPERLHEADIVIASTGASAYQIDLAMTRAALERRRYRPMLLIDLSVPRTISPEIAKLDNVFVFDVDDLQNVIAHNVRERQREAARAETIIDTEASQFLTSLRQSDIGPTVAALKQRITEVCDAEFARQRKHLGALTPEQEVAIRQNLLGAIVNKIMHPMILGLRESVQQTGDADTVDLRRAFDLDTVVLPENKPEPLPEPTDIPDDPPVTFSSKRR